MSNASEQRADREYLNSLARGLSVLRAFSREKPEMALSEIAAATKLSPAVARRCLITLQHLGYVAKEGKRFLLRPEVMTFAHAYLESAHLEELVRPHLQEVRDETGDSSSLSVLSGHEILYLVHVSTNRMVRLAAGVGTRFPAFATSMGRVLLAYQPDRILNDYFQNASFPALTSKTETKKGKLRTVVKQVMKAGYASVQDQLDYGIVSVAVPVFDQTGQIVAAINCSTSTARVEKSVMIETRLPALRRAAQHIEGELVRFPILAHSVRQ